MSDFQLAIEDFDIASLNEDTVMRIARRGRVSGVLTVVVADDEMNNVFYSPKQYGRGEDVYIIRRVLEILCRNPLVNEVYALEFHDTGWDWLLGHGPLKESLDLGYVRCLLDIYGPVKAAHGEEIGEHLLGKWGLVARSIRTFSKSDSEILEKMGIMVGISKPDGKTTEHYEQELDNQANDLIKEWFAPHQSRFRQIYEISSQGSPAESLTELGAAEAALRTISRLFRDELHEHKKLEDQCHTVKACLENRGTCETALHGLACRTEITVFRTALNSYLGGESSVPICDSIFSTSDDGVQFAVSKALSLYHEDRNGTDSTQIPGVWLAFVTGHQGSELNFFSTRIGRKVPVLGILAAIKYFSSKCEVASRVIGQPPKLLTLTISIADDGRAELESLKSNVEGVFYKGVRAQGGSFTNAFEALADGNFELNCPEIAANMFSCDLRIPLIEFEREG